MSKPHNLTAIEAEFKQHLKQSKRAASTIAVYVQTVHRFLEHVGNERLDRLSEKITRAFFASIPESPTKQVYASAVHQFLIFAVARLPVPVNQRGGIAPLPAKSKKEAALREKWTVDKLVQQKNSDDDLIAKLARKVIDGYLICQQQIKGEQNLDDLVRYVDECRDLIETNLPLFMSLSAQGRNVHSKIDERIQ